MLTKIKNLLVRSSALCLACCALPIGVGLAWASNAEQLNRFKKEFVITDLSVVARAPLIPGEEHAARPEWGFSHLVTQLFGAKAPAVVRDWMLTWSTDTTINGDKVPARPNVLDVVVRPWMERDGIDPNLDPKSWVPNLKNAPFRLTAIVNRLDLAEVIRDVNQIPVVKNAGEGRFVFCVSSHDDRRCEQFNIILEFELSASNLRGLVDWAQRWNALSRLEFKDPQFNNDLASITKSFATVANFKRLRTNEVALAQLWEMREFVIAHGNLQMTTVAQTPAMTYESNQSRRKRLIAYISSNVSAITREKHTVPRTFLGGRAIAELRDGWLIDLTKDEATKVPYLTRHAFSKLTCNGCHTGESGTGFTHIRPRRIGNEAALSAFLSGTLDPRFFGGQAALDELAVVPESQACTVGFCGFKDLVNGETRCVGDLSRRIAFADRVLDYPRQIGTRFLLGVLADRQLDPEIQRLTQQADKSSDTSDAAALRRSMLEFLAGRPQRVH